MPPLYTLLATGDPALRSTLTDRLGAVPDLDVVETYETAGDVSRALESRPADLLVIDARLPPGGGRAALEGHLGDAAPAVIVTAAGPGDGLWAYALGAVDCLPSEDGLDRLDAAVSRARDRVRARRGPHARRPGTSGHAPPLAAPTPVGGPLVVRSGSQLVFIDPSEIDWIEAAGVYVTLHVGATKHLVRESLRRVEVHLDPGRFVRIHRSTILNLERVCRIVPHDHGAARVVLKDGTQLRMSRSYRERIHATIG